MLSSSFNFPPYCFNFFDSTTTNSFYSANFSLTLIIPLTPNLHKNEINRRLLYSLTSSCLFSTCTKKLYKSCTTVSRGDTIPLSMQFLSVRRSSIPHGKCERASLFVESQPEFSVFRGILNSIVQKKGNTLADTAFISVISQVRGNVKF